MAQVKVAFTEMFGGGLWLASLAPASSTAVCSHHPSQCDPENMSDRSRFPSTQSHRIFLFPPLRKKANVFIMALRPSVVHSFTALQSSPPKNVPTFPLLSAPATVGSMLALSRLLASLASESLHILIFLLGIFSSTLMILSDLSSLFSNTFHNRGLF